MLYQRRFLPQLEDIVHDHLWFQQACATYHIFRTIFTLLQFAPDRVIPRFRDLKH